MSVTTGCHLSWKSVFRKNFYNEALAAFRYMLRAIVLILTNTTFDCSQQIPLVVYWVYSDLKTTITLHNNNFHCSSIYNSVNHYMDLIRMIFHIYYQIWCMGFREGTYSGKQLRVDEFGSRLIEAETFLCELLSPWICELFSFWTTIE